MWLFCFVLKLFLSNILAYNLDVTNAIVYTIPKSLYGRRNSYFGYATALYRSSENVSAVLVGAPRANTSYSQSMLEPGAVYVCPVNNVCKEWIIDKSSNEWIRYNSDNWYNTRINQIRNNSWVGAVIVTEKSVNPRIMVCAPRWLNGNKDQWLINGMCYWTMTNGMKSFNEEAKHKIFPASNNDEQYYSWYEYTFYDHAMAQVGMSAHITKSNERSWNVLMGAPGVFLWTGIPILFVGSNDSNTHTIIPEHKRNNLLNNFDYFGYSVTSGCYYKIEEKMFASGSPRGSNMHGHAMIYNFPAYSGGKLDIKTKLEGKQYGEYFGAALASCDVNNDGKDDLIVGAPLWSKDVDEGRVYIYHAWRNNLQTQIIEGEISGGRFGSTVSCLGDIDYDGYSDIAIGAPYEKDNGAIYIYNGNKDGIFPKYSQKILGSQFSENIRGFGISISEPQDINHDKYPDIAVGAYLSEKVILLTSKPVITIKVNLAHSRKKLLRDTKFFNISICTIYNGEYAPERLDIVRILEVDSFYRRASYSAAESNNFTYILPAKLNITEKQCDTFMIILKDDIQNVIDPLLISVVVDLNHTMQVNEKSEKNSSHISSAVINKLYSKTEDSIKLSFVIECGDDNICESDLEIFLQTNLKSTNTYIIGSKSNLELAINVHNKGEPAYQTEVHIILPDPLLLASINPKCSELPWINNNLQIVCTIGNPLITNETLTLKLDTSKVNFDVKNLTIYANITTQSEEKNPLDNNFNITVYFDIDIDIAIAGKTQEDLYSYFHNDEEDKIYPESIRFQHIYEVQKFGVSPITEAVLMVEIPTHWIKNDNDIELISINQTITDRVGSFVNCIDMGYSKTSRTSTETTNEFDMKKVLTESSAENVTKDKWQEKLTIEEATLTNVPPENRTLFINCSNSNILCKQFKCELNSFSSSLSVIKLIFTLDLKISNVQLLSLENKDIVYFASKGAVTITQPPNIIQASTNKPDTAVITTTFLGAPKKEHVAGWILAVSIVFGILLLILIILGLLKLGFFNRRKKEELEALKAMSNKREPIVLETSSSEVVLNQE